MQASRTVLMVTVLAASCAHAPPGHESTHVPGIRIIRGGQGGQLGLRAEPHELRFGPRQDGTKLVLDFLENARRAGAQYVSDIRIELVSERGGRRMACSTRLLPHSKRHNYKVPHQIPGRVEMRQVLKPVTRTVTEYQYQCRLVSRPVTRHETRYEYRYDYSSKSSRSVPVSRSVTRYESRNECSSVPVTRTVTRYEYQMETKYIPPRLTYLSAHYTDFDLVESPPVCAPVASPATTPRMPHRIVGTIYLQTKAKR